MIAFVVTRLVCPAVTLVNQDNDSAKAGEPTTTPSSLIWQLQERTNLYMWAIYHKAGLSCPSMGGSWRGTHPQRWAIRNMRIHTLAHLVSERRSVRMMVSEEHSFPDFMRLSWTPMKTVIDSIAPSTQVSNVVWKSVNPKEETMICFWFVKELGILHNAANSANNQVLGSVNASIALGVNQLWEKR
jgi:hypothetical protein